MSRLCARLFHLAVAILGATGAALVWMVYFAGAEQPAAGEEFTVVGDPWQPLVTAVHILAGPVLVFLVGLVWTSHVWTRLRCGATVRRPTGIVLVVLFPLLVLSGYLLQTAEGEMLRTALGWTHAGVGVGFAITYLLHLGTRPSAGTRAGDPEVRASGPTG